MTGSPQPSLLGPVQRAVLVIAAVALAIGLTLVRGGLQSASLWINSPADRWNRRWR